MRRSFDALLRVASLASLLVAVPVASRAESAAGAVGDAAWESDVLERVRQTYGAIETLEATFVQENDWSLHEDVASYRGHLYVTADGRVRIEYDEPRGHLFVADGHWHWTYVPESGQVIKSEQDPEGAPISRLFLDVLAGRRVSSMEREGDLVALHLEPEKEIGLSSLTVFVDPETGMGRRFLWTDLEGNTASYVFAESSTNVELSDDLFVFHPPEGVEVIELDREERW